MKVRLRFGIEFEIEAEAGEDAEGMRRMLEARTEQWEELFEANLMEHLRRHVPAGVKFSWKYGEEGEEWKE
jgi:hypothetical protein